MGYQVCCHNMIKSLGIATDFSLDHHESKLHGLIICDLRQTVSRKHCKGNSLDNTLDNSHLTTQT
jgi:hypothetical protein